MSYPPTHHHSTTRISTSAALTHLSAYLEATLTDPSLHPNALLTENGPITPSAGATTGLVLHNLKRVEAGLKGEHLGADLDFEKEVAEGFSDLVTGDTVAGAKEVSDGGILGKGGDLEAGWQDKEEFEREQDVVQGELGTRDNGVDMGFEERGGHMPKLKITKSSGEKEARKKAKKARKMEVRREMEQKKQRERDAEG